MFRNIFLFLVAATSVGVCTSQSLDHFKSLRKHKSASLRSLLEHNPCVTETEWFYLNETISTMFDMLTTIDIYNECTVTPDRAFCDFSIYEDLIASSCSAFGGNLISLDLASVCDHGVLDGTIRDVPLCVGQSCDVSKVVDIVTSMLNTFAECQVMVTDSKDSCEYSNSTFVMEDTMERKRCQWLRKKRNRIEKYCSNKPIVSSDNEIKYVEHVERTDTMHGLNSTHIQNHEGSHNNTEQEDFGPNATNVHEEGHKDVATVYTVGSAHEACPFTCARYNKFVKKIWKGQPSIKSCKWLSRQSRQYKARMCKKKLSFGAIGPANIMCPHICGRKYCYKKM